MLAYARAAVPFSELDAEHSRQGISVRENPPRIDATDIESHVGEECFHPGGVVVRHVGAHPFTVWVSRHIEIDDDQSPTGPQHTHRLTNPRT